MNDCRRYRSTIFILALLPALLVVAWGASWAQNENESVGFRPGHSFESGQFGENIDILNGGVNLTVPIGQSFRLNPHLETHLSLSYNSKIWNTADWQNTLLVTTPRVATTNKGPFGIGFGMSFGRIYYAPERAQSSADPTTNAYPGDTPGQHNYTAIWRWVSPDGAQHEFLYDGATTYGLEPNVSSGPYFTMRQTNDLSYAIISGPDHQFCPSTAGPSDTCFRVETGDGLVYTLEKRVDCVVPGDFSNVNYLKTRMENESFCGWYTTIIEDRTTGILNEGTGHYPVNVHIAYDSRAGFQHVVQSITDSDGRVLSFHNCEWAQGGHCSNNSSIQCFADSQCTGGTCTHDDSGNPTLVNQCVAGSQDPNTWTASSRTAVATYGIDMPGPGTSTTSLDTTKIDHYGFVYERAGVQVADPYGGPRVDPVLKLLRIDYPAYTRAVGQSNESHEYSIYYGYCNLYGASCGGRAADDYGELVCRTMPLLRRVNGVDQITGDACAMGTNYTKITYLFDFYGYVAAFLSGGANASKHCAGGVGTCGGGLGVWTIDGITREMFQKTLVVPANSPTSGGTWTYTRDVTTTPTPTRVTVTDTTGNDTVYSYHSSPRSTDPGVTGVDPDDGLAPDWSDGLNYQVDYYEGSRTTGRLVRSAVYDYDTDRDAFVSTKRIKNNTRKFSTVTRYADDSSKTQTNFFEAWDGVGHWLMETKSSSDSPGAVFTRRTYHSPHLAATFDELYGVWMPGLVETEEVYDGTRVLRRTDSQYDATRGWLLTSVARSMPLSFGAPQNLTQYPEDVKTTLTYSATSGNIVAKSLSSANAGPTYQVKYTYVPALGTCPARAATAGEPATVCGGYLATKGFVNGTVVPWLAIDRDRDANTGLIVRTRDTAAVSTDYAYDELGRIKSITPLGEVATLVDYPTLQETKTTRGTSGTSGYVLADYRYDGLGKVVGTGKLPYDDTLGYSCKTSRFDAEGRTTFESEPFYDAACNPGSAITEKGTTYLFTASDVTGATTDPFGRVRRTVPADANRTTGAKVVTTDYFGNSSRQTVRDVAGPSGVLFPAVTTFYHDGLGRLVYVDSPSGKKCSLNGATCVTDTQCTGQGTCVTAGGGADASYSYDGLDRLVDAEVGDGTVAAQPRTMTYDGLGHLRQESHPENGTTIHTSYDALGNPLEVRDAAGNLQRVVYDFAGRPTQKKVVAAGGTTEKIVVVNTYDSDATQRGSSLGKLIVAQTNGEDGISQLTESQFYQGIGGRLSSVVETFPDWTSGVQTGYVYDTLGQLASINYPIESPASHTALTIDYVYSHGVVTKAREHGLNRDLGTLTYTAAGAVATLDTPGQGRSQITYEDRNRPKTIVTGTWTGSAWSNTYYQSGTYAYDGAGNISGRAAAGSGWESATYGYDASNRLVAATTIYDTPTVSAVTFAETYAYDPFGNMTQHAIRTTPTGALETNDFHYTVGTSPNNNQIQTLETWYGDTAPGTSTGLLPFSYDANGNVTQGGHRYITGGVTYDETRRYEYDIQNRVEKAYGYAETGGQPYLTELDNYIYDSRGNRISKTENNSGMKTFFIRDSSGQVLSEFRRPSRENALVIPEWAKDYVSLAGRTLALKENLRPEAPTGLYGYYDPDLQTRSISWQANTESDVTGYKVYRKRQMQDQSFVYLGQVSTTTYLDNTVQTAGIMVMYQVTAVDSSGNESVASAILTIVQGDTTAPETPSVTVTAGDRRLTLSWPACNDNSGVLGYEVDRKDTSGTWRALTSNLTMNTILIDLNLTNGTTYYYRVRAKDRAGIWGAFSAQATGVPKDFQGPVPPRDVAACVSGDLTTTVNISWDPNPDSDGSVTYKLYRNTEPRFDGSAPAPVLVQTLTTTSYSDVGLAIGAYYYAVKAVDGATPANESAYSAIQQATTRNPANVPPTAFANGHDGSVDVSWSAALSGQTVRVYRRPDATRTCYTFVGEVTQSSAIVHGLTDATVSNNSAYEYAITTTASGVESAYSKPTLGIPLARAFNMYQCQADSTLFDTADVGAIVVQWTPPTATAYQPLLATTSEGTFGFLKGYHLYHHAVGQWPEQQPNCQGNCFTFIDDSKMRRVLASQGDSIDPYLVSKPDANQGAGIPMRINDHLFPLKTYPPVDPDWTIPTTTFESPQFTGDPSNIGHNCVIPRAVYKVYAQGTWLTAESDWPPEYHSNEPDSRNRCTWPVHTYTTPPPVPYCGWSSNDPNYVAPPTSIHATAAGPGAIQVTWTPPTGTGAQNVVGYNVYMFRVSAATYYTAEANRPLPFATVGADTTSLTISGLKQQGPLVTLHIAVHSFDSSGRYSFGSGSDVHVDPGVETADPGAPRSVKTILWGINDQDPTRIVARKGIKLGWQSAALANGASLLGFRVYRSTNPLTYGCALLASTTQTIPLATGADPVACVTAGTTSGDFTAGSTAIYFRDPSTTQGATYYYRVTQITQKGQTIKETPLSATDQVAGTALIYDENRLPPPQGFSAYAPQNATTDMANIYLQWCAIPTADASDNLPAVTEYWVYRTVTKDNSYQLLAKLSRDCIENDGSGHAPRCEIKETNACMTYQGVPQACSTIHRITTCGGASQLPCAVVDMTPRYWPLTWFVPTSQAVYNYSYRITAIGTDPATESMPSLVDEGWLNYQNTSNGTWFERRDPEGIPAYKVCGGETVQRYDQPGPLGEQAAATESIAEVVAPSTDEVAPDRIIGQSNPYSPPARFVFYHADHLGSPRVILNDTGQVVATHHYLPFGDERPAGTDSTLNTKAFTGHERDTETGLDYMMARYYSSSLGRFMEVDPGDDTGPEDPQSWNKYTYVRDNPMGSRDPDGKITMVVGAAIGAGVEYASEVIGNFASGKTGVAAFTDVSVTKIGMSAAVGAATSGLSAIEGVGVLARAAIGAAGSVAEAEGHALADGKTLTAKEAVTSAALGGGAELAGAAGKAIAQTTDAAKGLQGTAKRLANIAAEGRPRPAQAARAAAAGTAAREYGEGAVAETVKQAATKAVDTATAGNRERH